jgi:hypothetical protein
MSFTTEPSPLGLAAGPPVASPHSSPQSSDLVPVLPLQISGAHVGRWNFETMEPLPLGLAAGPPLVGHQSSCWSSDLALFLPSQVSMARRL